MEFHQEPALKCLRERPDTCRHANESWMTSLSLLGQKVLAHDPRAPPASNRDARRIHQATTLAGYRSFVPWATTKEVFRVVRIFSQKASPQPFAWRAFPRMVGHCSG